MKTIILLVTEKRSRTEIHDVNLITVMMQEASRRFTERLYMFRLNYFSFNYRQNNMRSRLLVSRMGTTKHSKPPICLPAEARSCILIRLLNCLDSPQIRGIPRTLKHTSDTSQPVDLVLTL